MYYDCGGEWGPVTFPAFKSDKTYLGSHLRHGITPCAKRGKSVTSVSGNRELGSRQALFGSLVVTDSGIWDFSPERAAQICVAGVVIENLPVVVDERTGGMSTGLVHKEQRRAVLGRRTSPEGIGGPG